MTNFKITLEYDGTNYHGWQRQKNTDQTIQQKVEDALSLLNKSKVTVYGAGRTDSGVHARGQVASFKLNIPLPAERLPAALNSELPSDIICHQAKEVESSFHARYDAQGKKYCYRLANNRYPSVFNRRYVYNIYRELDIEKMKQNLADFKGSHDFSAFEASGSEIDNSVREIREITFEKVSPLSPAKGPEYRLLVRGDGFLYNMVRIIAGTLIEVGLGKLETRYSEIIASKDRRRAGFTAPARGLTLLEVYY